MLVWLTDGTEVARGACVGAAHPLEPGDHTITLRYQSRDRVLAEGNVKVKMAARSRLQERFNALMAEVDGKR